MDITTMATLVTTIFAVFEFFNKDKSFSEHINRGNMIFEYEYDYISYKLIFYSINILISMSIIKSLNYLNDCYFIWSKFELYIGSILLISFVPLVEFLFLGNKYIKLKKTCMLIKDNSKRYMLGENIEKKGFVKSKLKDFSTEIYSCVLGVAFGFETHIKYENLLNSFFAIAIIIYVVLYVIILRKSYKTKHNYYIVSNLVVRANFKRDFNCLINIILNRNVKLKVENGLVHIYKRKNTLIYLFPQEYLIDVQTWCRVAKTDK